ncbi:LemA family protein [Calothrix sp. NIES-2098]|uniref:LemA family protein n=1 Tax=Calothrix sp. NIES-2098 TaxID=1954171 RepID=UPI000B5E5698|nr:putative lemA protein [Calothrix sp. NIES-2098]
MFVYLISALFLLLIIFISLYNKLIYKKNQVDNAFATIDVLLQKRCDLIPSLVAVAQIYVQFEQRVLTEISRLRTIANSQKLSGNSRVIVEEQITQVLNKILIAVEAYPELKANQHFLQLQYSLNEVEEQISAARRFYNTAVTEYNTAVEMFPTNLIAWGMKYKLKVHFQATLETKSNFKI